jgi:tryptophan halogenase
MMNPEELRSALAALKNNIAAAVTRLPPHQQFLADYCPAGEG